MAFDAHREDYQRLGLRFVSSLENVEPLEAAQAFAGFGQAFSDNRDALPQSDADRAFHLVAVASSMIDYELPFSDDAHATELVSKAHAILDEAIQLDPCCYDALRMRAAADIETFEGFVSYLAENAEWVRSGCEERRAEVLRECGAERGELAAELAMRPYVRWRAMQASKAVIAGRNREALALAEVALSVCGGDPADVRFTAALAYAKLEDEAGLDELAKRTRKMPLMRPRDPEDAWMQLARLALAFKRRDRDASHQLLKELCRTYPRAALALTCQRELPDGVFARLDVPPFSEDEIILAASEATVLTQEGFDQSGRGAFGSWLAREAERHVAARDRAELAARLELDSTPPDPYGGMA